jgi:hypothetical protein
MRVALCLVALITSSCASVRAGVPDPDECPPNAICEKKIRRVFPAGMSQ